MINPVPVIFAQYLGKRRLRRQKASLGVFVEGLAPRCDSNLHLLSIPCDWALVSDNFPVTFMSERRALDLLTLVIKKSK